MKPKFLFLFLVLCSLTIDNVLATSLGTHGKIPDNETIYRVSKQRCWGCIGESLEFLFTHNLVRATKWEPLLFWDFQLEKYARWWALQRKADCKLQHSFPEGDFKLGENIYWGSGSAWRPGDAVSAWSEEEKYYDYATNSCQEGQMCGHYTQIVWKNTRRIGCARVVCDTGDVFMTCNYDPPGNYIGERPQKPDWRQREAATYAFGSILEGPSPEKLIPLVNVALNFMLSALTKDPSSHVKDTTAWALGRIFEFLHGSAVGSTVITQENCQQLGTVLLQSMNDAPNVAEKACGALYFLAQGYEEVGPSSPLTPFFQEIVQSLLTVTHREDAGESRLRTAAYETLNEVVRCSTDETAPLVLQLVPVIMMELHNSLEGQNLSSDGREKQSELQGLLCGCLQVIIQKLGSSEPTKYVLMPFADQVMGLFLRVFACRSATVHEEAMLAIGAVAYVTGADFAKYMPEFYRYLEMGLQNFEEYQVCAVTVGVVGDICRALEEKIVPYCDGIMTQLLKNLSSNQLNRSVKPPIFSCFGDIALAVGEYFEKYLMWAMSALQRAAELSTHVAGDDELTEYTNSLRNGILEAYSGIFQGFKSSAKTQLLIPYAPHILQFLDGIYMEKDMDDVVMKTAIGVLGDLADTLGSHAGSLIQQSLSSKDFLNECLSSEDLMIKESAEWAKLAISRAISV